MNVQAIVAAAGTGERLGGAAPKPFVEIHGRPLVVHTLSVFEASASVSGVIVAAHPDHVERMRAVVQASGLTKVCHVVAGGSLRSHSVRHALAVMGPGIDKVLVHDGARPLITSDFVEQMIAASADYPALVAAVPVKPTIKRADPKSLIVEETLDRACLWDIQTPQIFSADVLIRAYAAGEIEATDDAALVEQLGIPVRLFPGLDQNIKVTTFCDLILAEKLLEGRG